MSKSTPFIPLSMRVATGFLLGVAVIASAGHSALAQSGSRNQGGGRIVYPPRQGYQAQPGSSTRQGSATRGSATQGSAARGSGTQGTAVALSGYCPVCIIDMKQWVRGTSQFQVNYDGHVYYFPKEEIRQTFLANPGKYVPALGGDCTVCLAKMGKRIPGSVFHSAFHKDRLYLFPGAEQKQMFVANPSAFSDVDLAMNGLCAVCKVEMGKEMPGDPQFAAYHKGMRYLFPGEDMLKMFNANPGKYTSAASGQQLPPQPPAVGEQSSSLPMRDTAPSNVAVLNDAAATDVVTVVGTSTCAGCEHGVTPIGSPDSLGLGIETKEGTLYVVEEAHERYPDVYKGRFKNLNLEVSGTIIKSEGKVRWLQPTGLRVIPESSS